MKIVCIGAGPAGLYCAISMKLRNPTHEVLVIERNRPDDTFGWELQPDGDWVRRGGGRRSAHRELMELAAERAVSAE